MRYFKRLDVWARAHRLALDVFSLVDSLPPHERYDLGTQIRKAASSVPFNIAEGAGRRTRVEYARFLDIALGSASELEAQLEFVRGRTLSSPGVLDDLQSECITIRAMLVYLRRRIVDEIPRTS